ncbi:MAG: hypothetical protein NC111_01010 [Bacteroides sp.]|nr:hypothetical protein [Bacteroides sp.]MCM1413544.1 hypothetical protein [Bacteroides sp.]MCM1471098.1 hypothetical protein [Bacteroides sp.]
MENITEPQVETTDAEVAAESTPDTPQQQEPAPMTETQPADADALAKLERMLEEAEMRGYKRGINETLSRALDSPQLYEDLARRRAQRTARPENTTVDDSLSSRFLSTPPKSIWD